MSDNAARYTARRWDKDDVPTVLDDVAFIRVALSNGEHVDIKYDPVSDGVEVVGSRPFVIEPNVSNSITLKARKPS